MSGLLDLPIEVLTELVSYQPQEWSLCSKQLREIATPHLFRAFSFTTISFRNIQRLLAMISAFRKAENPHQIAYRFIPYDYLPSINWVLNQALEMVFQYAGSSIFDSYGTTSVSLIRDSIRQVNVKGCATLMDHILGAPSTLTEALELEYDSAMCIQAMSRFDDLIIPSYLETYGHIPSIANQRDRLRAAVASLRPSSPPDGESNDENMMFVLAAAEMFCYSSLHYLFRMLGNLNRVSLSDTTLTDYLLEGAFAGRSVRHLKLEKCCLRFELDNTLKRHTLAGHFARLESIDVQTYARRNVVQPTIDYILSNTAKAKHIRLRINDTHSILVHIPMNQILPNAKTFHFYRSPRTTLKGGMNALPAIFKAPNLSRFAGPMALLERLDHKAHQGRLVELLSIDFLDPLRICRTLIKHPHLVNVEVNLLVVDKRLVEQALNSVCKALPNSVESLICDVHIHGEDVEWELGQDLAWTYDVALPNLQQLDISNFYSRSPQSWTLESYQRSYTALVGECSQLKKIFPKLIEFCRVFKIVEDETQKSIVVDFTPRATGTVL